MGTFTTKAILKGGVVVLPQIAHSIASDFINSGYQVNVDELVSGGYDISITESGVFKAVLGMKTALKVTLLPRDGDVTFNAGVGIFGLQAIPSVISFFFFWPVLLTQIWGMIQQSKLDDRALQVAQSIVNSYISKQNAAKNDGIIYCTHCGAVNHVGDKYCSSCKKPL